MSLPEFYSTNESPFGSSYEEHVKKFWQTFLPIPLRTNPMNVPQLCNGHISPSDPVFYLPSNLGGTTEKDCSTSEGKGILIPVICVVVLPHEVTPSNITRQRTVAIQDQTSVTDMRLEVRTNSSQIVLNTPELRRFRIRTGPFSAEMPPSDAMFGAPVGNTPCIADGYYLITRPIAAGDYIFKFSGSLRCTGPDCLPKEPVFDTDNTINLHVSP
jgi:hypothetical protein